MDLINISLVVAVGITLFLGVSIFLHRREGRNFAFSFSLLSMTMAVWSVFMILYRLLLDTDTVLWIAKILYAIPIFIPLFFLFFVLSFTNFPFWQRKRLFIVIGLLLLSIAGIVVTLTTNLIVTRVDLPLLGGEKEIYFGSLYLYYIIYYLALFGAAYYLLAKNFFLTKSETKRNQISIIFIGTLVTTSFGLSTDLILPWFGFFTTNWLANFTSIFFMGSILYGTVQYNLFNFKLIATEILVVVIWSLLAVEVFLVETAVELTIKGIIFASIMLLSIFLVKSVYREVEQREEIERLATDLKSANARLKELDTLKSQFLSIASHDLRAPLTAIRNFMSIMLEGTYGKLPQAAEEGMRQVFGRATEMAKSVDSYLNVSRIEQGKMKYDFVDVDLAELLKDTASLFKHNVEEKNLKLILSIPNERFSIKADIGKLQEIFNNLVDNSIKYTPEGSLTVSLEKKTTGRARVTIEDTGVGMSRKTMMNLFKLFSPGEDSKKVNPSSTGVGLYITKAHVEAHGGKIWAESDGEGKGSRFIVELPLKG